MGKAYLIYLSIYLCIYLCIYLSRYGKAKDNVDEEPLELLNEKQLIAEMKVSSVIYCTYTEYNI